MLDSSLTAIHTTSLLVRIWAHSGVFLSPLGALGAATTECRGGLKEEGGVQRSKRGESEAATAPGGNTEASVKREKA